MIRRNTYLLISLGDTGHSFAIGTLKPQTVIRENGDWYTGR